jgi:polysaccharide biosynthesis/export protein
MSRIPLPLLLLGMLALAGCASSKSSQLPSGQAAYAVIPALANTGEEEIIRPGDRLSIQVMGEPELTSDKYHVDSTGSIQMPLAGEVLTVGLRPSELRDELVRRLGSRFIRDPQVAVIIAERRKTSFAVEGAVTTPGIFEATPGTTLLSAIAQAKSPTNTANLDEVMVFRTVGPDRLGARFNLSEIRKGIAADPQIQAGDTVVVGHSALKGAWREFLQAAPAFNIFYILRRPN